MAPYSACPSPHYYAGGSLSSDAHTLNAGTDCPLFSCGSSPVRPRTGASREEAVRAQAPAEGGEVLPPRAASPAQADPARLPRCSPPCPSAFPCSHLLNITHTLSP